MPNCKNWCVVRVEFCYFHFKSQRHLSIHQSTGPAWFALGLFANNIDAGATTVFNTGDHIIEFKGDPLTDADVLNKYGRVVHHPFPAAHTLPELLKHLIHHIRTTNNQRYNDGTYIRTVASICQHDVNPNADIVQLPASENMMLVATRPIFHNNEIFVPYHNGFIPNQPSNLGPHLTLYFETYQIRTPRRDTPKGIKVDNRLAVHRPVIHGGVLPGHPGNASQRYTQPIAGVSTYDGQRWDRRYIHKRHNYGSYPGRVNEFLA